MYVFQNPPVSNGVMKTDPFVYFSCCFKKIEQFILMMHRANQRTTFAGNKRFCFYFPSNLILLFVGAKKATLTKKTKKQLF